MRGKLQCTPREGECIDKTGRVEPIAAQNPLVEPGVMRGEDRIRIIDQWPNNLNPGGTTVWRGKLEQTEPILMLSLVEEGLGIKANHRLPEKMWQYRADIIRVDKVMEGERA